MIQTSSKNNSIFEIENKKNEIIIKSEDVLYLDPTINLFKNQEVEEEEEEDEEEDDEEDDEFE